MAETGNSVSLRKRQQIEGTAKAMFMWVAIASALAAIAVVVSFSLVERLMFNQRILNEKGTTASNLRNNNQIVEQLRASIREVNTNQALIDTPKLDNTQPLSVILDALPSQANTEALGASLEQKLLKVDGVTQDGLPKVDPISESTSSRSKSKASSNSSTLGKIPFSFKVSSRNPDSLRKVLQTLERSIRVLNIENISVEQNEKNIMMSVDGIAYYSPEVKVELKEKSIRPSASGSSNTSKSKAKN